MTMSLTVVPCTQKSHLFISKGDDILQFCVHHQITAYKNKTKEMTGALIIQNARTKSITDALYPCNKEDGKDVDVTEDDKLKSKKGKKKRHKSTAPNSISKPGTYYRIMIIKAPVISLVLFL